MNNLRNKIVAITIVTLFALSMAVSAMLVPNAHATVNLPTIPLINVSPNPCGVGQTVTVDFFLASPTYDAEVATGMTVKVTTPSGVTSTLGPFTSDITGGTYTLYTPTATGNYTFVFNYAGQNLTGAYSNFYEEPGTSSAATLVVGSSPATGILNTPLPTTWWQTPVTTLNSQNWYNISGPWWGFVANFGGSTGQFNATGNYNPYTDGPTTAHILWVQPWRVGGTAGGSDGSLQSGNYWTLTQYEAMWNAVVIDGLLYATHYTTTTSNNDGIVCTNLYTGQTEWVINTTNTLKAGVQWYYHGASDYGYIGPFILTTGTVPPEQTGGALIQAHSVGTQINFYDAFTGRYLYSLVNGTSPTYWTQDSKGDIIGYYTNGSYTTQMLEYVHPVAGQNVLVNETGVPCLCAWNMSMCFPYSGTGEPAAVGLNSARLFNAGIMYATPMPYAINGVNLTAYNSASHATLSWGGTSNGDIGSGYGVLTVGAGVGSVGETAGWVIEAGFNLQNGACVWGPVNRTETPFTRLSENGISCASNGIYFDLNEVTDVMIGYNIATGAVAWGPITLPPASGESAPNTYDAYGIQDQIDPGHGVVYLVGFGGDLWAVSMTTGKVLWVTDTAILQGPAGTNSPYGVWPLWCQYAACESGQNQMLYLSETHQYDPPFVHGWRVLAVNATNGKLAWDDLGADMYGEVSYGIYVTLNEYDGQVYAYGQGPSSTTVSAPQSAVTTGTPVMITGTVMDVSPGTKTVENAGYTVSSTSAVAEMYPNGVPCVADDVQNVFMDHLYQQQPLPTNLTGVPVTLTVTDVNHNTYTIGTTTTNPYTGAFGYLWTPPITGNYTITANFAGSGAYYGSNAETFLYAGAPPATLPPTASPPTGLASTGTVELGVAAIVIVIIVIGAILAILMMRKRP